VELARIKFSASNEAVDLQQVALQASDVASNTPYKNLVGSKVTLWTTGGTKVGEATFVAGGDNATSTLSGLFRVPKDGSKVLVVKGDISGITVSGPMTQSGELLKVDYDGHNNGLNGNYGTGVDSGDTVTPTSGDTSSSGVRIMAAYPTFEKVSFAGSGNELLAGEQTLYKFKVTAVDGDVAFYKFTFDIGSSTQSATSTDYGLYAYSDSGFSLADTTFSSDGLLNYGPYFNGLHDASSASQRSVVEIYPDKTGSATTTYVVPEGATRYFELKGTFSNVAGGSTSESVQISLLGDAAFPVNSADLMQKATGIDADTNSDLIWSPISTTTQNTVNDLDFTNGYQVSGLPTVKMSGETLDHD
jgi:hypothetical protein